MTKIPLRSYTREIESLIERGMNEEALAHCRFILKHYPKHIEAYRLLGKVFLESQRYSEAADILTRIMSVFPDDFFAQIGMSIIREDEGNLDAAIFHMERAYETQPANIAVQDELRRLYGRRDGAEPHKLRLSRGALVRMYVRGGLNRQAVSEIHAALQEDPQRIDLEIILAKIHHLLGEKAEAVEIASRLVSKIPYCYEANQILVDILPSTAHADDAQVYLERLLALDPYLAYISPSSPTASQVPDNAVMIDRLEWQPSEGAQEQPAWAQSVGVQIQSEAPAEKPDWLTGFAEEAAEQTPTFGPEQTTQPAEISTQPAAEQIAGENEPAEAELPDWMREAGWTTSNQPQVETPQDVFTDETASEEEPSKAELPDWLKNLAPANLESEMPEESEAEKLSLLNEILPPLPEQGEAIPEPAAEAPSPEELPIQPGSIPDWLREFSEEHLQAEAPSSEAFSGLPFSTAEEPESVVGAVEAVVQSSESTESEPSLPEWSVPIEPLEAVEPIEEQTPVSATSEAPAEIEDWLKGLSAPSEAEAEEHPVELPAEAAREALPIEGEVTTPVEEKVPEEITEEWFASLEPLSEAEEILPESEALPDWLKELEMPGAVIEGDLPMQEAPIIIKDETEPLPVEVEPAAPVEISEALTEPANIVEPILPTDQIEAVIPTSETGEEIPAAETLPPTAPEEIIPTEMMSLDQEGTPFAEPTIDVEEKQVLPELEGSPTIEEVPPLSLEEVPPETTESPALPDLSDADAAMAWLEALAARHGAAAETLITPPEERLETPPDWVSAAQNQLEESVGEVTPVGQVEPTLEGVEPNLPEEKLPSPAAIIETVLEENQEDVSEPVSELPAPEVQTEPPEAAPALATIEEPTLPAEVEGTEEEQPQAVPTGDQSSAEQSPAEMDFESAFAWLESLAAQQGAEAETLITPAQERLETPPAWVAESSREEAEFPTQPVRIFPPESAPESPEPEPAEAEIYEPAAESATSSPQEAPLPEEVIQADEVEVVAPLVEEELQEVTPIEELSPEQEPEGLEESAIPQTSSLRPLPDWLKGIESEPEPLFSSETPQSTELPDWLRGLESTVEEPKEAIVEATPGEPLPDWISPPSQPLAPTEEPVAPSQEPEAITAPSWVQEMGQGGEENTEAPAVEEVLTSENIAQFDEHEAIPSGTETPGMLLNQAQAALAGGKVEMAMRYYSRLLQNGMFIEDSIHDLRDALYRFPVDISIWQTLGDAYLRNNQLQEALDAYTKAEEFLR